MTTIPLSHRQPHRFRRLVLAFRQRLHLHIDKPTALEHNFLPVLGALVLTFAQGPNCRTGFLSIKVWANFPRDFALGDSGNWTTVPQGRKKESNYGNPESMEKSLLR